MKNRSKTVLALLAAASVLGAMPSLAVAQQGGLDTKNVPTLEYQQADVREVLRALFRAVNASYTIAPEVQGTVTLSLKNVSFETALQSIVRQINVTYHIEGGVYNIVPRTETAAPVTESALVPDATPQLVMRRIPIHAADPAFVASMLAQNGGGGFSAIPERSTITNARQIGGGRSGGGGLGQNSFGGGASGSFGGGSNGNGFGSGAGNGSSNGGGVRG